MKIGIRKPSIKKSIKARTTGKIKRSIKRTVNPLYSKKGAGWVKDPKRAMYNKVYNKTTIGVSDLATTGKRKASKSKQYGAPPVNGASPRTYGVCGVLLKIIAVCMAVFGLLGLIGGMYGLLIFAALLAFVCWKIGAVWTAWGNLPKEEASEDEPLEADDINES